MEFGVLVLFLKRRSNAAHLRILPVESSSARSGKMIFKTVHQAKRFLKILFGFTLLAIGIILIATPGPGALIILIGLGVLAAEFVWARRLLDHLKEQGLRLRDSVFHSAHHA